MVGFRWPSCWLTQGGGSTRAELNLSGAVPVDGYLPGADEQAIAVARLVAHEAVYVGFSSCASWRQPSS